MENTKAGLVSTIGGNYIPPKLWKDLSSEEKLERMREIIKSLENRIPDLRGLFENLKNDFQNHGHLNEKVVKDVKTHNQGLGGMAKLANPEKEDKGEVYF